MTKKVKGLMEVLCKRETLERGADDALSALKDKNVWYAKKFIKHRKESLDKIQNMLISGKYPTKLYKDVEITTERKKRVINPEHFDPWNILLHAIKIVLEPISERILMDCSSAGRPGKGQIYGANRIRKFIQKNPKMCYYGSADLRKFYPSIPHLVIYRLLRRYIDDEKFINCIKHTVTNYRSDIEDLLLEEDAKKKSLCNWASEEPLHFIGLERGVTLGSPVGQMIGNWVGHIIDYKMVHIEHAKGYHRHCDDIAFFGEDKNRVRYLMNRLDMYCNELGVCVKASSFISRLPDESNGIAGRSLDFIGWVYTMQTMKTRKRTKVKSAKAFARVKSRKRRQELIGAYYGIFKWGNCKNLWNTIIYKGK